MKAKAMIYRVVVLSACAALSLSILPLLVKAKNDGKRDRVVIHLGTPAVWSLGQAHYLLAKMQRDNLGLGTNMPDRNALDPNGINATKIQIVKTLLDIEAQFSQKIGATNRAKMDAFKDKLSRRDEARADLKRRQAELDAADEQLRKLKERRARLATERQQIKDDRERPKPDPDHPEKNLPIPPPGDSEKKLEQDIAVLDARITAKEKEREDKAKEIASVTTAANEAVAEPSLEEVELGETKDLPAASDFITERLEKVISGMNEPRFAASIALDNFIGMQYEIIAKQLTLLRDEVGPDERIVFLELPSSIYTAACKGDEHIAQVQWEVNEYYDDSQKVYSPDEEYNKAHNLVETSPILTEDEQNYYPRKNYLAIREDAKKPKEQRKFHEDWTDADSSSIRAVDIIPRQSALNVNDVQSTTSQVNFLGVMKLLVGFGLKVNYQKQRELYEQYLQQEVFAAGFGKGRNAFGWTFGPLPGTKRIAPGVRTTYAVLVVPRKAALLKLKADGVAFHRKEVPDLINDKLVTFDTGSKSKNHCFQDEFTIIIPNENTERFRTESIFYTPATNGQPVTVVVKGDYFSQQAGILVDGVPLTRTISVGNTATSTAVEDSASGGIRGQYELVSSREIVMKFSMPDGYVGTPNITLVTPEKSSALNFLKLLINAHRPKIMLRDLVLTEPMFMPDFSLQKGLLDLDCKPEEPALAAAETQESEETQESAETCTARLKGTGLRRKADVWINGMKLPLFRRDDRKFELVKAATKGNSIEEPELRNLRNQLAKKYADRVCAKDTCDDGRKSEIQMAKVYQLLDDEKLFEAVIEGRAIEALTKKGVAQTADDYEDQKKREMRPIRDMYTKPPSGLDVYLEEQTTGEYSLRFIKALDRTYKVRYRQNAISGVEADEFEHTAPAPKGKLNTAQLMSYAPNAKAGTALVDVRFKSADNVRSAKVSPERAGRMLGTITDEGENQFRGTFLVNYDDLGDKKVEKTQVSITASFDARREQTTSNDSVRKKGTRGGSVRGNKLPDKTYDITIPVRPQITTITASISADEGGERPVLSLEGINLQRITKVSVGDKVADIVGAPEQGILIIKLPKGMSIKKDVTVQIPLTLETADGVKVSIVATIGKPRGPKPEEAAEENGDKPAAKPPEQ